MEKSKTYDKQETLAAVQLALTIAKAPAEALTLSLLAEQLPLNVNGVLVENVVMTCQCGKEMSPFCAVADVTMFPKNVATCEIYAVCHHCLSVYHKTFKLRELDGAVFYESNGKSHEVTAKPSWLKSIKSTWGKMRGMFSNN